MSVIYLAVSVNGDRTDLDVLPKLESSDASFGLRRVDTGVVLVASGTDWERVSTGYYKIVFTDPAADLDYEYSLKTAFEGITTHYVRKMSVGTVNNILTIPTNRFFSSEAEVIRLLGNFAVDLIFEDWSTTNESPVWNEILSYTDEIIHQYIGQYYNPELHKNNAYLRRRATILSAHQISQRRGNPALYMRESQRIYDEFEEIRSGRMHVPGAIPIGTQGPVIRNYVMQPSVLLPQRVVPFKSTGDSYPGEKNSYQPYLFVV